MKLRPQVTPEKVIQDQILYYLRMRGLFVWQNKSQGTFDPVARRFRKPGQFHLNGVPDILGILPDGKFLGIEVKSSIGRLSPPQKEFIEKANSKPCVVFMARSLEDVISRLKELRYL